MKLAAHHQLFTLCILCFYGRQIAAAFQRKPKVGNVMAEIQVVCLSDAIIMNVNTNAPFNGMVYAKDAPNASNCVSEYQSVTNMSFRLPLKSCGTLFAEVDDGIEYFNTVVVQPHMRLMTNQGKGYHIRCKYQTRERTISNTQFNVSASFLMANNPQAVNTPLLATASMPSCTMKIFRSGRDDVAETVKIGDKLIMVIEIDQQDMYGMKISNCLVRDGMNLAEQQLINDVGCPIDEAIMPKFVYTNNSTRASVSFPAHKFPHTSSVYYQCNVRLCINNGGCEPTECNGSSSSSPSSSNNNRRRKRGATETAAAAANDMSFDVFSGLYVSDLDVSESGSRDDLGARVLPASRESAYQQDNSNRICVGLGQASLVVILACTASVTVALMLVCQLGSHHVGGPDQQVGHFRVEPSMGVCRLGEVPLKGRTILATKRHHYQFEAN